MTRSPPGDIPKGADIDDIQAMAAALDLRLDQEHMPGVAAAFSVLAQYAQVLMEFSLPSDVEPAPVFSGEPSTAAEIAAQVRSGATRGLSRRSRRRSVVSRCTTELWGAFGP